MSEDFWSKVDRRGPDDCWWWDGPRHNEKYGYWSAGRVSAHRAAWMLTFGQIAAGLYVCHTCDRTLCVNPRHLFLAVPRVNTWDAIRKGRRGPRTHCQRGHELTPENRYHHPGGGQSECWPCRKMRTDRANADRSAARRFARKLDRVQA
jgi:hypothetical protein